MKTEQGTAYVALKKLDDGSCVFLDNNLCLIHPIRPAVCASFPFVFRRDDDEIVSTMILQSSILKEFEFHPNNTNTFRNSNSR